MPEDSLSILEERIKKLISLTVKLREEQQKHIKEKEVLKVKVENIAGQVDKIIGGNGEG